MPNAEQLYEIAVQHANNGLPVFPCVMNDKRPATARGFYDATTDLGQIDAWFKPQKNSGIVHNIAACPDDIGCFVVDCDGSAGATSWLGLAISTGTLGEAGLVIETPSGGRHYWFKGQLHSSVRKVAPGIDIRGIGGYVLLPGSSIDGREYKIVGSGSFDQITPAPPALFEYFTQAQEKGEYVQRITSEYAPEPGSPVAHAWCRAWTERQINAGRLPQRGTRNAWATAFYIQMYTHGATAEYARELHELVYEHGGARPDVEPCPKIESLIERIWDGKLRCNPAGSELPLASIVFHDTSNAEAAIHSPVELQWGNTSTKRAVSWLWKEWLASGKIHILAGESGTGKTTIALKLLAAISRGDNWPGTLEPAPRGRVLIWSSEDDWEDTLLGRFEACGGDLSMIAHLGEVTDAGGGGRRPFDPSTDMPHLTATAKRIKDLRAIVVDPIVTAHRGDGNSNTEVRRGLLPLYYLAKQTGAAIIGISHFTKGTMGRNPTDRVTGSLAYGAVARLILAAAKADDGTRRVLVRAKSNLGPEGDGITYTLARNEAEEQYVEWGHSVKGTAKDLIDELLPPKGEAGRPDTQTQETVLWIRTQLVEAGGEMLCSVLRTRASLLGFNESTLRAALKKMGPQIALGTRPGRAPGGDPTYKLISS